MMENPKTRILAEIMEQFVRLVNKFNRFEKVPMDFGVEEMLFPSEIHTIEAIGKSHWINVTQLSESLGVTKGAVSQMIGKLENKNFVKKIKIQPNGKETFLKLTDKGKKALKGHEKFHRDIYLDFLKYAGNISSKDFRKFKEILKKIENHLDLYSDRLV
jgi:DNA-binding MarR family transcriptional regulator